MRNLILTAAILMTGAAHAADTGNVVCNMGDVDGNTAQWIFARFDNHLVQAAFVKNGEMQPGASVNWSIQSETVIVQDDYLRFVPENLGPSILVKQDGSEASLMKGNDTYAQGTCNF